MITGASASYSKEKNLLYINFAFFDEIKNETSVLKLIFKFNTEETSLESFKFYK